MIGITTLSVSETIGNLGFDEDIVPVMADARERFLKPGGALIPGSITLKAVPVRIEGGASGSLQGVDLNYASFDSLNLNIPMAAGDPEQLELLAPALDLVELDLSSAPATYAFGELRASWTMADLSRVTGFAVWAESNLGNGIVLSNAATSSWSPVLYRIKPLKGQSGRLDFKLNLTSKTNIWTVEAQSGEGDERQSFSPSFAAAQLLAQTRLAQTLPASVSGGSPVPSVI